MKIMIGDIFLVLRKRKFNKSLSLLFLLLSLGFLSHKAQGQRVQEINKFAITDGSGEEQLVEKITFNQDGDTLSLSIFEDGEEVEIRSFEYENGRIALKKFIIPGAESFNCSERYLYSDNLLSDIFLKSPSGTVTWHTHFEYDSLGNLQSKKETNGLDIVGLRSIEQYDTFGNLKDFKVYNYNEPEFAPDGLSLYGIYANKYNEGKLIESKRFQERKGTNGDADISDTLITAFTYDELGRLTEKIHKVICRSLDEPLDPQKTLIEYGSNGKVKKRTEFETVDSKPQISEFSYDKFGGLIRESHNGKVVFKYEIRYWH